MKNISFQAVCPGCGDKHFAIECKKPTFVVPTLTKVFCDHCKSVVLVSVSLPRNRTNRNSIAFQPVNIKVSDKLAAMIKEREAASKEVANNG